MTFIPHLAVPFRFITDETGALKAAVTDQDTEEEILDCVENVLRFPLGFRIEEPDFGVQDQTFRTEGVNYEEIQMALSAWEPRAEMLLDEFLEGVDLVVSRVTMRRSNPALSMIDVLVPQEEGDITDEPAEEDEFL